MEIMQVIFLYVFLSIIIVFITVLAGGSILINLFDKNNERNVSLKKKIKTGGQNNVRHE